MIGLIPRLLMEIVAREGGRDAELRVKQAAGVPANTVFRMNEPYPDAQWQALFEATCNELGISPMRAEHVYAQTFLTFAQQRFPKWFDMCDSARDFLELQPVIHNSFATGLQDPADRREVLDKFKLETSSPEQLVVHYKSTNRLCGLYIALAQLMIQHYGETATVQETSCIKRGGDECVIVVNWFGKDGSHG